MSDDRKGFIGRDGESRRKLEALCETRIMTVDEFCEFASNRLVADTLDRAREKLDARAIRERDQPGRLAAE